LLSQSYDRRTILKLFGASAVAANVPFANWLLGKETKKLWIPGSWNENTRPQYVWENHEDRMYHDLDMRVLEIQSAPEFFSFIGQLWVFNQAMEWHRDGLQDCIICHTRGRELPLTGEYQLSRWHTDPRNSLTHHGEETRFEKKSGRHRDCAVLPAFQFHVRQNPTATLSVSEASASWQFCASIKGRSGPPFLSSGWQIGPARFSFNIGDELKKRGYNLDFAEIHFVIGLWTDDSKASASVSYELKMPSEPTVIGALPVIRAANSIAVSGVPIAAVVLDEEGDRLGRSSVQLHAVINGQKIPLEEKDRFWLGNVHGLFIGDYEAKLISEGKVNQTGLLRLRVTDGEYFAYDKTKKRMTRGGKIIGSLTGSYQGTFYFREVGTPAESLVNTQEEWDNWDRSKPPGEHLHYWESLNESELTQRFAYLESCGWDLLHLHQHWGIWERLDAGGRISPHGAEQVALYMRVASRHKLALLQSLSSYEYMVDRPLNGPIGGTPPWSVYIDAGFKNEDWFNPAGTTFQKMFHQYLHDFTSLFREETALAGMLASGEGDHENGPLFTNDVFHYVKSLDPNHFFPAECLFQTKKLPRAYSAGFDEDLFGDRTYFIGDEFLPEYELGVFFKFLQTGNNYLAEGSWPTPDIYTAFHYDLLKNDHKDPGPESWIGTQRYRTRLRDTYYLGFIHRMPIVDTWDEYLAEDEHKILREVRDFVDWNQPFEPTTVVIRVDDESGGAGREKMIKFETVFSQFPLAYSYLLPESPVPETALHVVDSHQPYQDPKFASDGGLLPDALKTHMPLKISPGYSSNYLWSSDRRTLLAYIYNTTNHTEQSLWICGRHHRLPKPTTLTVQVQNLPFGKLNYRLYDLNFKKLLKQGDVSRSTQIPVGATDRDYLLAVTPS
jgi:hypothetical protein